ncbi:MAG: STAS domain-containing protein [Candidatus Eisenbacteria bacterium]|nr:STAS domain-containing protein [Candidatus Eisenbacteria bacterium]
MNQTNTSFEVRARIAREEPGIVELALEGRLDAEALPEVLLRIEEAREKGCVRFLVALDQVTFIGSAGIGVFLSLVEEMKNEGGGVVFLGVAPSIQRIFEVLNVLEFLMIREDREEAIRLLLSPESISTP